MKARPRTYPNGTARNHSQGTIQESLMKFGDTLEIIACTFQNARATTIRLNWIITAQAAIRELGFKSKLAAEALEGSKHLLVHPPVFIKGSMLRPIEILVDDMLRANPTAVGRFSTVWIRDGMFTRALKSTDVRFPVGIKLQFENWDLRSIHMPHDQG